MSAVDDRLAGVDAADWSGPPADPSTACCCGPACRGPVGPVSRSALPETAELSPDKCKVSGVRAFAAGGRDSLERFAERSPLPRAEATCCLSRPRRPCD